MFSGHYELTMKKRLRLAQNYAHKMKCNCLKNNALLIKWGKVSGVQRYKCKVCNLSFLESYRYRAYAKTTNNFIVSHLKESCSIRGISRLAGISKNTVLNRIKKIADNINPPYIIKGRSYEVDELKTYIGKKKREYWVVFALERKSKRIVSYCIGKRTTRNLSQVVNSLLLSEAKKIYTDKLNIYAGLIPKKQHNVKDFGTNHVERHHVNVRNNLKRLSRKTVCYSKSLAMLSACVKIYLWG